jgi:hypothetical protein
MTVGEHLGFFELTRRLFACIRAGVRVFDFSNFFSPDPVCGTKAPTVSILSTATINSCCSELVKNRQIVTHLLKMNIF